MLKRIVLLVVVGSFLAVPPAIAKSSSTTVKAPAAKVAPAAKTHSDGQCPFDADDAAAY
jgi:hypothetical protein